MTPRDDKNQIDYKTPQNTTLFIYLFIIWIFKTFCSTSCTTGRLQSVNRLSDLVCCSVCSELELDCAHDQLTLGISGSTCSGQFSSVYVLWTRLFLLKNEPWKATLNVRCRWKCFESLLEYVSTMYYGRQSVHRPNCFTPNSQTNIHETLPPPTCKGVVHTLGNAKLEARTWLSRALSSYFSSMVARRAKRTRQPRSCYVTLSNIHQF